MKNNPHKAMILTVTPNPCVDKTVFIDALTPGAKIRSRKFTCIPGGKGTNVSRAVKALGGETVAMVIVGGHTGRHVVEMIETQDGVRCAPVWVKGMTRTITTVLEEPVHRQTALFEPGPELSAEEKESVVAAFRYAARDARVTTFNGASSCPMTHDLYATLIPIARDAGALTVLDSYGPDFALALDAVPYMVKPNREEAEQAVGFALDSDAACRRAMDIFHEKGVRLVVLSLGAEGAIISRAGERLRAIPPKIREVNPVGSGDALVAAFAIGLMEGWPLEQMAQMGVAAGAANACSWDIGHFTREEVHAVAQRVYIKAF